QGRQQGGRGQGAAGQIAHEQGFALAQGGMDAVGGGVEGQQDGGGGRHGGSVSMIGCMTRPAFALPRLRAALFTPLVKRLFKPLAAALAIAGPGAVGATGLPPEVSEALRQAGIPPEASSMVVVPVDGPAPRLAHLSELSRQPASLIKLFTTGAALSTLGPAFSWRTEAALGGPLLPDGRLAGPLFLRGSGDPSLVLEKVW